MEWEQDTLVDWIKGWVQSPQMAPDYDKKVPKFEKKVREFEKAPESNRKYLKKFEGHIDRNVV